MDGPIDKGNKYVDLDDNPSSYIHNGDPRSY